MICKETDDNEPIIDDKQNKYYKWKYIFYNFENSLLFN